MNREEYQIRDGSWVVKVDGDIIHAKNEHQVGVILLLLNLQYKSSEIDEELITEYE